MSSGLKYTFLIHAIVAIVFGAGLFFVPSNFLDIVNWTPSDPAMTRGLGAALIGLAASSWLAYRSADWANVRIVVRMENVFTVASCLGSLWSVLFSDGPSFLWVNAAITGGFAVLFGYFGRAPQAQAVAARS